MASRICHCKTTRFTTPASPWRSSSPPHAIKLSTPARLIRVGYEARRPVVFGPHSTKDAIDPPQFLWPVSSAVGNADAGVAGGDVRIERTYTTSDRHHNQIEPHVAAAVWDSTGTLTLYEPTQYLFGARELVSIVLGLPPEKIIIVSHFVGGGYGGKAYVWPHTLLAALAAKVLNRPVRVQLTRAQMYSMVGHQPATIQTIVLGAGKEGKLTGLRHESTTPTSVFDNYIEYAANCTRSSLGGQRRYLDDPQDRTCEPRHSNADASPTRSARAFRARECDGRTRLRLLASIRLKSALSTTPTSIRTAAGRSRHAPCGNV